MAKAKQCKEEVVMGFSENDDERPWEDIPGELLRSVSHLSLSDRIRFRLTCKGWKNLELPPRSIPFYIDFNSACESSQEYCPWFLFYHSSNSEGKCNYFHPICNDKYLFHFPEIAGSIISHSKHGWLLMSRGNPDSLFFFHPLKRSIIDLPDPPFGTEDSIISFSSPPTAPDCVVFCTTQYPWSDREVCIHYCRHGSRNWHTRRFEVDGPMFVPSLCNPVFYDGVFYTLSNDGRLGVFDPTNQTWEIIPKLRGSVKSVYMSFIAECDGDLISVFFTKMGISVHVFRLDWNQMKWVKLEDLGDRMMYVSHTTSLLLPAVTKGTENKIYLPRFREEGNVYYSLFTGKYSIFDREYSKENWYDTFEYMNCTWIDLNNNRTEDYKRNSNPHTDEELDWLSNPVEDDSEDDSDDDSDDDSEDDSDDDP